MFDIAKYPKSLGKDLVIKRVGHVVDIFYGPTGWSQHARFIVKNTTKGKQLSQIRGGNIPKDVYRDVVVEVS